MYRSYPALIVGFHGCTQSTADDLISGKSKFKPSANDYDWLGSGMYFWENNPERAFEYAQENIVRRRSQEAPAVVGVVLDLGHCLNLLEKYHIDNLATTYGYLKYLMEKSGQAAPQNTLGKDKLMRHLDCAVIQLHHLLNEGPDAGQPYDSVRGVFQEGTEIYPSSGFRQKTHIQIAIRNPNCIKGFFLPRELDSKYDRV